MAIEKEGWGVGGERRMGKEGQRGGTAAINCEYA